MVEQSDLAPLLDWEETSPAELTQAVPSPAKEHGWESSPPECTVWKLKFMCLCVSMAGNMVEWCLRQDVNLDGVEFKSMASGSNRIGNDFIYFRKGCYFGLACFANMPVESELERGTRIKSVGILSPSYTLLYHYMHFLENQVRHQLQCPAVLHPAGNGLVTACPTSYWVPAINRCISPTRPAACPSSSASLGIMVLWKFALLRKRILMFSPPPVGVFVFTFRPIFYVNVADIAALATEMSYVKIFEEKKELYDVYVDNQNVKTHRDSLQPLLRLNGADREKYRKLSEQRQMLLYTQEVDGDCCVYITVTNRIFQTLSEVEASADHTLTAEHVRAMGLDPEADRTFLEDLLQVYGIDVMLVIDNPCCP
uniref:DENN domain-containing protein 11 n=1 Tax=Oncorhynchus kisutch TaxID=8019 RepID=A0A8C7KDB3_ONCKI